MNKWSEPVVVLYTKKMFPAFTKNEDHINFAELLTPVSFYIIGKLHSFHW